MNALTRWTVPVLLLGMATLTQPANASVTDKGDFFSPDAVKKANERITEVKKKVRRDLVIETFKEVPADRKKEFEDRSKHNAAFNSWAEDRAHELKVDGVYILLNKSPGRLQMEVGKNTQKKDFTPTDKENLLKKVMPLLKAETREKNDEALDVMVDQVTTAYLLHFKSPISSRSDATPAKHKEGNGIGGWICMGLAILAGVWLVIGLVRAFSGGGGGGGGYGGGGGGFFSTFMAGMFGAAAGMWMYNSFFGGASGLGGSPAMGGDGGGGDGYSPDTDYSGDGGDFGGDGGGGGDFGGGDFGGGGGDFGGGDF